MQLNRILAEARSVYEGMTDPVDNRRARWIVPPPCSLCRSSGIPGFDLETDIDGGLILVADLVPGQCGLLDPDLFQIGDHRLGIPREIRWLPTDGEESAVTWSCLTADNLRDGSRAAGDFYSAFTDLQVHQARGRLEFIFAPQPGALADGMDQDLKAVTEVLGRYLDGRSLRSSLATGTPEALEDQVSSQEATAETVEEAAHRFAKDRENILKSGQSHFSLSPDLLTGWPNPFNEIISIRFIVPRTMKDAFIWKNEEDEPTEIDLEGDVPWSGGQPGVSVKIYSINGQELVTLYSGTQGVGETTVQWNGTDAFGRKVASGTYFCKLQMDDWSVTRRLVFIR